MLDPAIATFLSERKAAWLKDKLKLAKSETEHQEIEAKANERFALENWLPDAAKRASQLSMTSHPGKFSHPGAKTSSVIAQCTPKTDGFLRSGNVVAEFDVFGNAAALDVHKFLTLTLSDGQSVLTQLEQDSATLRAQFTLAAMPYDPLRQGLLAIKQTSETAKTSEKIKQVYFPVDAGYHLLSILTPSGMMFKLKERINTMRFSDAAKQAHADRGKQQHNEQGYDEIYHLTVIGFGGTKPQNISVLNNQHGGTAYLLPSLPPQLQQRELQPPKSNFFVNCLYCKNYQESFQEFHRLLATDYNNINIRTGCDNLIRFIVEQVIEKAWLIRQQPAGWSEKTQLPLAQKIWLDESHREQRENENDWLDAVIDACARWFVSAYQKSVGKEHALGLGDVYLIHIKKVILGLEEALR